MNRPRIAFVTPAIGPPVRGNGTTTARWMGVLASRGYAVEAVLPNHTPQRRPDIVHGYHAWHGGRWARHLANDIGCPLVVSLGGTDLRSLLADDVHASAIVSVLRQSDVVTGAFASFGDELHTRLKDVTYTTVRRGVYIESDEPPPPRARCLRALLVAGLRPVKNPLLAIQRAQTMVARGFELTLRILGPALDEAYAARVQAAAKDLPFVSLGIIPAVAMGGAYRQADVLWNTSEHEGGSNAVLEALAHGCAVALRDVPGNRELLAIPKAPGALFADDDVEGWLSYHEALAAEDDAARRARWQHARAWLRAHHDPEGEGDDLEAAYGKVSRPYEDAR